MPETVNVSELPVPSTHILKKMAKRTAIASAVVVAAAAVYLKVTQKKDEEILAAQAASV